ncbi:MAG: DUF2065 domain-containing protein [Gammaproteobacteria bacterium]|nr:DUF2065 domain-containing protein [Gammaproteobacteria bacterium]
MNWTDLLTALALVMVVEGIMPFISPQGYKSTMQQLLIMPNSTLRYVGLGLMVAGVVALFLVR